MPWIEIPIWHGSSEESLRLVDAIGRHCECLALKRRCSAHDLMMSQHTLDHLLFLRFLYLREGVPCAKHS